MISFLCVTIFKNIHLKFQNIIIKTLKTEYLDKVCSKCIFLFFIFFYFFIYFFFIIIIIFFILFRRKLKQFNIHKVNL